MSVSIVDNVIILDGKTEGQNLVTSEAFRRIQWMLDSRGSWHKVTIVDGWHHNKDFCLRLIFAAVSPHEILPFKYQQEGANAIFFVKDCGPAIRKLCALNLKLFNPTGRMLVLQIELQYPMSYDLNARNIIGRAVVSNMYDNVKRILCLSKFHEDADLVNWMYCPLTLKSVVDEVITVTQNFHATLRVLILSSNALTNLSAFRRLVRSARNLRVLDLQNNLIPTMSVLESLNGLHLDEIILDGNPLCEAFENETIYIDEVRKIFPAINKLDGIMLPPHGLPVNKINYVPDSEAQIFIEQFISYYFKYYDGWNGQSTRTMLKSTYHKEAFFSISSETLTSFTPECSGRLNKYLSDNRNLMKMSDYMKSNKYLHQGKDDVVKALCKLPLTEHDRLSLNVDLTHYSGTSVVMTVSGVYRELDPVESSLRSFSRVFTFSRKNSCYSIMNDMLFITNVTQEQAEIVLPRFPLITSKPTKEELLRLAQNDKSFRIKQNMVEELSRATEMNLKWSQKCLIETEWDFQEALIIFMGLYKEGSIPSEAFKF